MRPDIQTGSKIKVVDRKSKYYRWRGTVSQELTQCSLLSPDIYDVIGFVCALRSPNGEEQVKVEMKPEQVACVQKKFVDIEHIRENDELVGKDSDGNDIMRRGNVGAFEPGDAIQITCKIDGANASVARNEDEGKLEVFSRTNILDGVDGLRGFKAYVETRFKPDEFSGCPDLVIFGEWLVSHKCKYSKDAYNKWYVYDIWSKSKRNYLSQSFVRDFCAEHGLEYVCVLYEGPFVSWDHCRSFMDVKPYGGIEQEGIVVKNQTKLDRDDVRFPKYLKIVNEAFKESVRVKEKKEVDPAVAKEMADAKALMASVVTEARVNKSILKLVDEGVLPKDLTPKCMGDMMKRLPKLVFEDVLKEEPETVRAAGSYAGRFCSGLVAEFARKLIVGSK